MSSNQFITGINLSPSVGEFSYDIVPYRVDGNVVNCYSDGSLQSTDIVVSINLLKEKYPACKTINLIVSWFCNSSDANDCQISPSSIYQNKFIENFNGTAWVTDKWSCSGITQTSSFITINTNGGTPSDASVLRAIKYFIQQGFDVVLTPNILMIDGSNKSDITFQTEFSDDTTSAIQKFMGVAQAQMFYGTQDGVNYSGTDLSYRRMILHYSILTANIGLKMLVVGSGMNGLEALRGPSWTVKGVSGTNGAPTWDYPFVAALEALVNDVAAVTLVPLTYAADWTNWMGVVHSDFNCKIPHLDQLYANPNISVVSINNYFPLSDWTQTGGLDAASWGCLPAATQVSYPPSPASMNNLGLIGEPTLNNIDYLQANIEGGENFSWYYNDNVAGFIQDNVVVPDTGSDRFTQQRNSYKIGQDLFATKRLRWWWNNTHKAIFDLRDGRGSIANGKTTQWIPGMKSITFLDYGFPAIDRCTNQPNSKNPFWGSIINGFPKKDFLLCATALQAVWEYWQENNEIISNIPMMDLSNFMVSNWDIRTVPNFPLNSSWTVEDYWKWMIKSLK